METHTVTQLQIGHYQRVGWVGKRFFFLEGFLLESCVIDERRDGIDSLGEDEDRDGK
jgi:hypothetical protein